MADLSYFYAVGFDDDLDVFARRGGRSPAMGIALFTSEITAAELTKNKVISYRKFRLPDDQIVDLFALQARLELNHKRNLGITDR